jgi:hypothetical protein
VDNIRDTNDTLTLYTNGGILTTSQKCDIPQWGEVWFEPDEFTNIFSYAEMAERYKITTDSEVENAFIVHISDKKVKFEKNENNLYIYILKKEKNVQLLSSVEENKGFYTSNQFERAKKARDLYHAIGSPSVPDFKDVLRMNMISKNPVTTEDIELTERIFGPDTGALKGKMIQQKPIPVVDDRIEIPKDLIASWYAIKLFVDIMNVNGLIFFTTISEHLKYRMAQYVMSKTLTEYLRALQEVLSTYHKGGFKVTEIYCDKEFRPLQNLMINHYPDVKFNFANPNEHVPEVERSICVIKERIWDTYHCLIFDKMPRTMIKI